MKDFSAQKVRTYLKELLCNSGAIKLPSMRAIAQKCGVSVSTVCKVTREFERNGTLNTRWGYRVERAGESEREDRKRKISPKKASGARKWEAIRDSIALAIRSAQYRHGSQLPQTRSLQTTYSASYGTVRRALEALTLAGYIEPQGGGYRVVYSARAKTAIWRPRVVVISAGNRPGVPKAISDREQDFYRFLTAGAVQCGIEIELVVYDDWQREPVFLLQSGESVTHLKKDESVLGYILSSWHIKDCEECIFRLSVCNKPISVWMENTVSEKRRWNRRVRFFNIGYSEKPGEQMAHYLMQVGHTQIAYVSPFHGSVWSQMRLRGIKKALSEAGHNYVLHPFVNTTHTSEWSVTDSLMCDQSFNNLLNTDALEKYLPGNFRERITNFRLHGIELLRDNMITELMSSALDLIVENQAITAVIGANDLCALLMMHYIQHKAPYAQKRIALCGFDNSFEGLQGGLTSFNFNTHSLTTAMLDFVLHPSLEKGKAGEVYYFEGSVIERLSTAKRVKK
ncbi:GntR family transcriptional regulator [Chitinispirillales bacterium ANBcel5]|uniref:GntR family transcriptional regulator n=1 Tax=Cellulosispirillum alkaliphilum TaxID=3039283 RepID=UPI002A506290|nr:GntR family transcriptional regulator [Chitinispirillales bacterium ANBcel5]